MAGWIKLDVECIFGFIFRKLIHTNSCNIFYVIYIVFFFKFQLKINKNHNLACFGEHAEGKQPHVNFQPKK